MISYLRGKILGAESDSVTVDVNGVGYEVLVNALVREKILQLDRTELFIYTAVREDAITLFGFQTVSEKQLFLTLIKVNGVGPKLAMNILGGAPVDRILQMIEAEDVKGLTLLPKVGKKTAEQLILSLKGKLPHLDGASKSSVPNTTRAGFVGTRSEILSALMNLGFRGADVESVVQGLAAEIGFEEGVRKSLATLSQGV